VALLGGGCGSPAVRVGGDEDAGAQVNDSGTEPAPIDDGGVTPEDPDPPDASVEVDAGTGMDAGEPPHRARTVARHPLPRRRLSPSLHLRGMQRLGVRPAAALAGGCHDRADGHLHGAVHAVEAFYLGDRNIQGATSFNGRYWLSATRHCGALFAKGTSGTVKVNKLPSSWASMSEGLHYSSSGNLWTLTEGVIPRSGSCSSSGCSSSTRIVFAVNPAP